MHVVRRDHVNRARNADHAARTCERFVYSIVKITRLYDYQTWRTHLINVRGAQRYVGFFLDCAFRMLIGWEDELPSRGSYYSYTYTYTYSFVPL